MSSSKISNEGHMRATNRLQLAAFSVGEIASNSPGEGNHEYEPDQKACFVLDVIHVHRSRIPNG
jgi:hypothetical protein